LFPGDSRGTAPAGEAAATGSDLGGDAEGAAFGGTAVLSAEYSGCGGVCPDPVIIVAAACCGAVRELVGAYGCEAMAATAAAAADVAIAGCANSPPPVCIPTCAADGARAKVA